MDRYHAYGVREVGEEGMIRRDSRGRMAALWGTPRDDGEMEHRFVKWPRHVTLAQPTTSTVTYPKYLSQTASNVVGGRGEWG